MFYFRKFMLDFFDRWLYNFKTYTTNILKGDTARMKKSKSLLLLLTLVLAVGTLLSACGSNDSKNSASNGAMQQTMLLIKVT